MKSVLITGAFGQLGKSCSELLKNNFELILSGTYPSDSGIKLDVIEQKSVKTVLDKKSKIDILDLAGSGFESTVRLAKSSPDMWTPIFSQNKSNILKILDDYIKNLIDFKTELLNDNFSQIKNQIKYTNELKSVLDNITKKK